MTFTPKSASADILFGAFDRHNFGDLLLPHVHTCLMRGRPMRYAGLARRDLRRYGGHRVDAVAELATRPGLCPASLIHAGGEILCCEAWEAAVMLLPPGQAGPLGAHFEHRPRERLAWARSRLGVDALAPYTLEPALFPRAGRVIYNAVGGVDLDRRDPLMRAEVFGKLRAAAHVSARDAETLRILRANGIPASLLPDPAVMAAALFGPQIWQRARHGEVAQTMGAFPRGYLAVQFSEDFGDDATLDQIAAQLHRAAQATGCGVVLFRAGAAPWHDGLSCYARLAQRLRTPALRIFRSLDIWDICAVIAHSRGFAGSSLHGRIVAMAFALPRLNFTRPGQAPETGKQAAFAATWEAPGTLGAVALPELADGIGCALAMAREQMARTARELVAAYRDGFVAG